MLSILIFSILGIIAGTISGLAPGIHINLIASFLVALSPKLSFLSPLESICFIVAMSITHLFIDFIPSVYLGAPDEDTFLSILPGHEMLKQGHAHEAIILTSLGSLAGILISLLISPPFIFLIPKLFPLIQSIIPYILILLSLFLIFRENFILPSIISFILGGFLGFSTFNLEINQPLLPLLSGLFGLSSLIISIKQKTKIPKQEILSLKQIHIPFLSLLKSAIPISLISPLCSILPGIGSGQATIFASEIQSPERKNFLFMQGISSSIFMIFSFLTLYTINKARSGSASAISQLLPQLSLTNLVLILILCLLISLIAFPLSLFLSKRFSYYIQKINYSYISIVIIFFLTLITFYFSGPLGLLILLTSTSLGIYTSLSNIKRSNLMSALIIPAIIYYLTL